MTSCFCFSLCKCSILFLPDWLFLLLAAHGRIWPPYQPKSYIPSKSCIQRGFSVSVFQIHICRKVNRWIGGNQVYTLGPVNPGYGPTWEPDFWEGERKGSLKRGLEMGWGGTMTSLWDKWLLSDGMVVMRFLLPLLSDSSVLCASVQISFWPKPKLQFEQLLGLIMDSRTRPWGHC